MDSSISIEDTKNKLIKHSLRVTHQRIVVLQELIQTKKHPTAENIYNDLRENYPSLSLATIYKTLNTFENKGLVKKIKANDDSVHYEADTSTHYHLICIETNKIINYDDDDFSAMIDDYFKKKKIDNFNVKDIQINIFGELINSEK